MAQSKLDFITKCGGTALQQDLAEKQALLKKLTEEKEEQVPPPPPPPPRARATTTTQMQGAHRILHKLRYLHTLHGRLQPRKSTASSTGHFRTLHTRSVRLKATGIMDSCFWLLRLLGAAAPLLCSRRKWKATTRQ